MAEHRRIHNGDDNLDTCTACAWASWDTSPSFAEHVTEADKAYDRLHGVDGLVQTDDGWASYAAEQERHAETTAARDAHFEARNHLAEKVDWLEAKLSRSVSWSEVIRALRAADVPEDSMATDDDLIRYEGRAEAVAIMRDMLGV